MEHVKHTDRDRKSRRVLSASTLTGDAVVNAGGEKLRDIKDLMIDLPTGKVAYAVLSFGGFLGMGDKLFAEYRVTCTLVFARKELIFG